MLRTTNPVISASAIDLSNLKRLSPLTGQNMLQACCVCFLSLDCLGKATLH